MSDDSYFINYDDALQERFPIGHPAHAEMDYGFMLGVAIELTLGDGTYWRYGIRWPRSKHQTPDQVADALLEIWETRMLRALRKVANG